MGDYIIYMGFWSNKPTKDVLQKLIMKQVFAMVAPKFVTYFEMFTSFYIANVIYYRLFDVSPTSLIFRLFFIYFVINSKIWWQPWGWKSGKFHRSSFNIQKPLNIAAILLWRMQLRQIRIIFFYLPFRHSHHTRDEVYSFFHRGWWSCMFSDLV